MSNKIDVDDVIMTDDNIFSFARFYPRYNSKVYPRKRTYIEMLNESNQTLINSMIENYKLINKNMKLLENHFREKFLNNNTTEKADDLVNNIDLFDTNKLKKNLIIKKKLVYDEEKEKKFVENYYRIKNAELNKLRFGTE